jgi:large subunit ribosomal protein L15
MPLFRRLPKYGFNNPFREEPSIANVSRLARLVDEGALDADDPVTPEALEEAGAIRSADLVKILGDGEIDVALDISAHAFSASAKEKIEAAGGTATVID